MQKEHMHNGGITISLVAGDYYAEIVSVGAGLARLTYQGCHLVIPHKPEEMPLAHLGKVLIPWPNRIENGCYHHEGHEYQLPINEHSSNAAIHGLLAWRDWQVSELTASKVILEAFLPPCYGYPFPLLSQVIYSLNEKNGLSIEIISKNIGNEPSPYGAGIHPYVTCNLSIIDECILKLPAKHFFSADNQAELYSVDDLGLNYLVPKVIADKQIDHTFKTCADTWEIKLIDPQKALAVSVFSDQPWVQIYSGEKLNRRGLAVEPMSCPPNSFNSKVDLILLQPEQSHRLFLNIRGRYL